MKRVLTLCTMLLAIAFAGAAQAAETKEDLQKRFAARAGDVAELKKAGKVGETSEGYLDFVEARSGKASDTVNDENADRRKLYELIATETGTTADVVAKRNAKRNFEKAPSGEFLKEDGKWRKKE